MPDLVRIIATDEKALRLDVPYPVAHFDHDGHGEPMVVLANGFALLERFGDRWEVVAA